VLIAELQISRNTLREAFQQLSVEGLTEQRLYKGTVVRRVSLEEVRDIFVSRRTFELRAVEESVSAPAVRLQTLRAACCRTEHAARRQAWSEVGTASLQFHQAVVGLLGSRKLDSFFEILAALLRLAFSEVLNEASFQAPWVPRDREICELICAGRLAEAVAAMEKYLADSEQILLDLLHATRTFAPAGGWRGAAVPEPALDGE
jgi:DNA-binding GntR family transcriptional regulator